MYSNMKNFCKRFLTDSENSVHGDSSDWEPLAASTCSQTESRKRATASKQSPGEQALQEPLDNPITDSYDVGPLSCTAGPGLVWRVHDATRKADGTVCSVFICLKRFIKNKHRETCEHNLKKSINRLFDHGHPRMLLVFHPVVEGPLTLCFASEHVFASLDNIMTRHKLMPRERDPKDAHKMPHPTERHSQPSSPVPHCKEYNFLDFELRYGLLQVVEALQFMHYKLHLIHRNVCPQTIIICKRGTWKLFGLEFVETINPECLEAMVKVSPWSMKIPDVAQPNLDYMAPEAIIRGHCNIRCDVFSLGHVMCTIYSGASLLQPNRKPQLYIKQIESLVLSADEAPLSRMPPELREMVRSMCTREPELRPSTDTLDPIACFKGGTGIRALQYLDEISMKDAETRTEYYEVQLKDALPYIPDKLRWQMLWPALMSEIHVTNILQAAIYPIIWIAASASPEDFSKYVTAPIKYLLTDNAHAKATIVILEKLGTILGVCPEPDLRLEILPAYYKCFDSEIPEIRTFTLVGLPSVAEYINDDTLHGVLLMKVRRLMEENANNAMITGVVIRFYNNVLQRLDSSALVQMVPTLLAMRLDAEVINFYKIILTDERFALPVDVLATQVIPALTPQTVNTRLEMDEFTNLMEILHDMLEIIDQGQRPKLNVDAKTAFRQQRLLSLLKNNDDVIPFEIPNLRVQHRKTISAEHVIRKHYVTEPTPIGSDGGGGASGFRSTGIGQWFFGSKNSNNDNSLLRVMNIRRNRRSSDNAMVHKNRLGPSISSSPGSSPRGSVADSAIVSTSSGLLAARRHSSVAPRERRNTVPTAAANAGRGRDSQTEAASAQFLLMSPRRPSAAASTGAGPSMLQQISSGVARHLPGSPPTRSAIWSPLKDALNRTAATAVRKCSTFNTPR